MGKAFDRFDAVSPLDYRYMGSHSETLAEYLSENARIRYQARAEAALVKVLAKNRVCSAAAAKEAAKAAELITAEEVYEEEKSTRHDVRALVNVLRSKVSASAKPYIHFSATSYDIVDTSNAARYKAAAENLIIPALKGLEKNLIKIALREKSTLQMGRTHGQHAEPITFGFAIAEYVSRLGNRILAIEHAKNALCGKFSGAVGAYNASSLLIKNPRKLEREIMKELGLKVSKHSTQVVEPESLQDLMHALTGAFTVLANFADDMRNLQRSEIAEVAEAFGKTQVGSSTMPHKRNPINFENVKSLWKEFMPRMNTVYMDAISEHQRDLTNSASARFIQEVFAALYVSARRMEKVTENLAVDDRSMLRNFSMSRDSVIAEPLYILLAKYGHGNAHEVVRLLTLNAQETGKSLPELVAKEPKLMKYLRRFSPAERRLLEKPERYTGLSREKTEEVCSCWKKELRL